MCKANSPKRNSSSTSLALLSFNHLLIFFQNSVFSMAEHPRFGIVITVVSTRFIRKDQEILLDYQYGNDKTYEDFFPWYFDSKEDN